MARQNYRQLKKQKEQVRKARQTEKQQRRQTREDTPTTVVSEDGTVDAAGAVTERAENAAAKD